MNKKSLWHWNAHRMIWDERKVSFKTLICAIQMPTDIHRRWWSHFTRWHDIAQNSHVITTIELEPHVGGTHELMFILRHLTHECVCGFCCYFYSNFFFLFYKRAQKNAPKIKVIEQQRNRIDENSCHFWREKKNANHLTPKKLRRNMFVIWTTVIRLNRTWSYFESEKLNRRIINSPKGK